MSSKKYGLEKDGCRYAGQLVTFGASAQVSKILHPVTKVENNYLFPQARLHLIFQEPIFPEKYTIANPFTGHPL